MYPDLSNTVISACSFSLRILAAAVAPPATPPTSDLESLCDDFYMIHAGKIILHEDTDVLLSDYAVLKVAEEEYEKLDKQYLIKIRKEAYGYRCLTNQKQFYMENYPDVVIENGKIDDLVVMMEEQV